jgi:hypothetical protein
MTDISKYIARKYADPFILPDRKDILTLLDEVEYLEAELRAQFALIQDKINQEREACAQIVETTPVSNEGPIFRLCQGIAKTLRARK